jgi:dimethylargininase
MRALVRRPSSRLAEGLVMGDQRPSIDMRLAQLQWEIYCGVLEREGWTLHEVPPADDCPDSVFIEDTMALFGSLAVLANPAAPSRRPEVAAVAELARSFGWSINSIVGDGTLDGGDVLKVGRTVYVGRSARTNAEGVRQLRAIVGPAGYQVVAVPVTSSRLSLLCRTAP